MKILLYITLILGLTFTSKAQDDYYDGPIDIADSTAFLGVYYLQMNPDQARMQRLPTAYGALVLKIVLCSAAEHNKFRPFDYITAINNEEFSFYRRMREIIQREYKPGDEITLTILRDGELIQETVTLGSLADKCDEVSEPVCFGIDYEYNTSGQIEIKNVESGYAADVMGIKKGDLMLSVNDFRLLGPSELSTVMNSLVPLDQIRVRVWRAGQILTLNGAIGGCDEPLDKEADTTLTIVPDLVTHKTNPDDFKDRDVKVTQKFETWKEEVTISIWDDLQEDGDTIVLIINDQVYLDHFLIRKKAHEFTVKLKEGSNIIQLVAINLGSVPPNTVAFKVTDGIRKKFVVLRSDMNTTQAIEVFHKSED